jgi:anaerobic magnesium-protoporphyrin IX monomethyl ester cyclase
MMSKIIFIEPKAPNLHIYSQFVMPRLGSYILGALMKQQGWDVDIIFEEAQKIDFDRIKAADLVGISTITSTAPRAYAIADRIREMGVPVILGGPHVTFLKEEALRHADFVIRGEGERPLKAFIQAWEKGEEFDSVPNLSYKINGKMVHNPIDKFVQDLDEIPFPDLPALKNPNRRIAGHTTIPVQTSRGCPYDCSFCSVTGMFGRQYRFRSTQNIIEELRRYDDRKNFIFFYDDNFAAHRKRTKALLESMIKEKFRFKWSTQVRADVAKDEELVRLMKKAGCHTLYIGFESVNPGSLEEMKKKQTVKEMHEAIRVIQRHGINIHGMFVYGFDEDDWQTVKKTVKFARKSRLTSTQFLILTPLPGSETFNKMKTEKRIVFDDWALYDAHHVVFRPKKLTLTMLQKAQMFSHRKFYSWVEMMKKLCRLRWIDLGLAHYARQLNRAWSRKNRTFLKVLDLLTPKKFEKILVEYRQKIQLDG